MIEKLTFDAGIKELEINENGVLTFNPSDFNVYKRFMALAQELPGLEKEYESKKEATEADSVLSQADEIDQLVKAKLAAVFGPQNDFDKLLGGVNVMAMGNNGQRIITNFLNALLPYMEAGIKRHMKDSASEAVAKAKTARAKRGK